MASLASLPYELHLQLLTHVCHLGSPPTLLALLLTHPSVAPVFSQNRHVLIPLLAHALPRRRYELALGVYNMRRCSRTWRCWEETEVYPENGEGEGAAKDGVEEELKELLLKAPVSFIIYKAVLRVHRDAEAEIRRRRREGGRNKGKDPYVDWYEKEMRRYEWRIAPKWVVRNWVRERVDAGPNM